MNDRKFIIPAADIYENKDKFLIIMDMPGSSKESIEISAEDDVLTVHAKVSEIAKDWKTVVSEFELYDYQRQFTIGNKVNRESIQAKYENGILTLELEKSEQVKPKKIEVKAA